MSQQRNQPLSGGSAVDVAALELTQQPVQAHQNAGIPTTTGVQSLGTIGSAAFGVWEMSQGKMYDVEAEEIFVITAGRGSVYIAEFNGAPEHTVELFPGVLMRLSAGMRTTWSVSQALRKVYITPREES